MHFEKKTKNFSYDKRSFSDESIFPHSCTNLLFEIKKKGLFFLLINTLLTISIYSLLHSIERTASYSMIHHQSLSLDQEKTHH